MFGHLQVYSGYSFQESTLLVSDIVAKAKALNQPCVALTDTNNLYGAIEFYTLCQKNHLKPIIGMEASVMMEEEIYPFILLAMNTNGYFSLCKISSCIQIHGYIQLEELITYKENIIILTPGDNGIIERNIEKSLFDLAINYLTLLKNKFGDHFYVNIHSHHIAIQDRVNQKMIELTKKLNIQMVCSNEVRYMNQKDYLALEFLQASKKSETFHRQHQFLTDQKYFKSEEEMKQLFDDDILKQTSSLIDQLNVVIPMHQLHMPVYPTPSAGNSHEYLKELCMTGLKKRFKGKTPTTKYITRLQDELRVIDKMGYSDYFLIVWDYVRYAKINGILVGPGRGSAAGSLVAYVLGITNCDPIQYDLLFERFLNEDRISMPDIDIDFQDNRREEVVNYIVEKYGKEHVAGIVTFSSYGPRVALKDVGKVLNIPLPRLERLCSMVPTSPKNRKSVLEMYQSSARFQTTIDRDNDYRYMIESVFLVERLPKNTSQHAAGIVLSQQKIDSVVPVCLGPNNMYISQYSKDYIEDVGLIKMDLLGLKNLSVIDDILKMIQRNKNIEVSLNDILLNDTKVYQMIANGDTFGVFQLESEGMKDLLRKMRVSCFEDIVAANALFRPGPMNNIPIFLARKHGKEPIEYLHPDLEPILSSTYGIMIYQEQIMQIAKKIAGFSLAKADILRKAISKKETKLMDSLKDDFIQGALSNGYSLSIIQDIYESIMKFASYGFNKSHSVAYAYVAYQMAYLKAHYPLEFFASLLTGESNSTSSKLQVMQEGRKYGVSILPPSINQSTNKFEVEGHQIRYSLTAIKNIGEAIYQEIESVRSVRKFDSIFDFFVRIYHRNVSVLAIESLIDAGAFDEFKYPRKSMKDNISKLQEYAHCYQNNPTDQPILRGNEYFHLEKLEKEKEVLGIYLSKHPITLYKEKYGANTISIFEFPRYVSKKIKSILVISRVKTIFDRNGKQMCFIHFYDESGSVEAVVFSQKFECFQDILKTGNTVYVEGKVEYKDSLSLHVEHMKELKLERTDYEKINID